MISASLQRWQSVRRTELDQIAAAHGAVGGTGPGRRWATLQINQAYAMLLSAQFQGFCRDLHSEYVDHVAYAVSPAALHATLRAEFVLGRKLDRGNPNPGNIGADFERLGLSFWDQVRRVDARNSERQSKLVELNEWPINAVMGRTLGSPLLAAVVSIVVSLIVVIPVWLTVGQGAGELAHAGALPWWAVLGGVLGVVFVGGSVIVGPALGLALFFVCVVAGQLLGATLIDQVGAFGVPQKPINLMKVIGLGLVLVGAALVQRSGR